MTTFNGDVRVDGDLSCLTFQAPAACVGNAQIKSNADITRTKHALESNTVFPVLLTDLRVHDNLASLLPAAGAADDLAIVAGTLGTDSPMVQTGDLKAAGATTRYARVQIPLPPEYEAGQSVTLRFSAGMLTTVADTSATIDVQAYAIDREGAVGSDLCATAAQSINSLTFADFDFTITEAGLSPGDVLDVRIAIAVNDGATGTAVIGAIGAIELLADIRG